MTDKPSLFDTACAVVLAETEIMMRRFKTGRQLIAESEAADDVEAWLVAEAMRRQIGGEL